MDEKKIGICEWSLPIDGPAACKFAAFLGIQGIQLDIGSYERGFSKSRRFVQDAYLEEAEKYGISFPSMAARVSDYYSMVAEPGSEEHCIVKEGLMKAIEACGYMNIPVLLVPNFEKSYIATDRQFDIVCELMMEACDAAGGLGVTIAAENTLGPQKMNEMIERVGAGNFGLYFDLQNYYLANKDYTPRILEELYPNVIEVHVKDGKGDELSGALLGTGDVNFYDSIKVLKENKYNGWLISENYYDQKPLSSLDSDPMKLIKRDLEILRKAIAE